MNKLKKNFFVFFLLPTIWFFFSIFPTISWFTHFSFILFLLNILYISFTTSALFPLVFWGAILDIYKTGFIGIYLSGFICLGWLGVRIKEKVLWFKISTQAILTFMAMLFLKFWQYTWFLIFELNLHENFKESILFIFIATIVAPIIFKIYDIFYAS